MYVSESETQVVRFLDTVWPEDLRHLRPDYIAYDRACYILRHLAAQGLFSWLQTTRFIVDAWHYIEHRVDDIICRSRCNPAPTDGSQPDLVIPGINAAGRPFNQSAYNTEAAELLELE